MRFQVEGRSLDLNPQAVIVAGFTGRDQAAVRAHVEELAAQGVGVPNRTPSFYLIPPITLTQQDRIVVPHGNTSGEVELALVLDGPDRYVTVASDHTDRAAEAMDISISKQLCPKVIGREAWPLGRVMDHWETLVLHSWIAENGERVLYQTGAAGELLHPGDLLDRIPFRRRPESFVLLGGTFPVIGEIRASSRFWAELRDPATGHSLRLEYEVELLDYLEPAA